MTEENIKSLVNWASLKIKLSAKLYSGFFKEGEIWWCSLGMNVGQEVYGKGSKFARPVLVYKKFSSSSFFGIPLTSKIKEGSWYVEICFKGKKSSLMLHQARLIDEKRLINRIGTLEGGDFNFVKERFLELYSQ